MQHQVISGTHIHRKNRAGDLHARRQRLHARIQGTERTLRLIDGGAAQLAELPGQLLITEVIDHLVDPLFDL